MWLFIKKAFTLLVYWLYILLIIFALKVTIGQAERGNPYAKMSLLKFYMDAKRAGVDL